MAGMLFPYEAKIAMEIAGADWTPVYKGLASKGSPATVNSSCSHEATSMSAGQLQQKLQALRKTGKQCQLIPNRLFVLFFFFYSSSLAWLKERA